MQSVRFQTVKPLGYAPRKQPVVAAQNRFGQGKAQKANSANDFCVLPALLGMAACVMKLPLILAGCCAVPVIIGLGCALKGAFSRG